MIKQHSVPPGKVLARVRFQPVFAALCGGNSLDMTIPCPKRALLFYCQEVVHKVLQLRGGLLGLNRPVQEAVSTTSRPIKNQGSYSRDVTDINANAVRYLDRTQYHCRYIVGGMKIACTNVGWKSDP